MEKEHQRDLTRKTRASYYGKVKVETTEMLYKKSWWFWTVPVWLEKNVRGQDMAYCKPIETVFFILGIALRSIQIPTWTSRALRGKKITFAVNRCYHFPYLITMIFYSTDSSLQLHSIQLLFPLWSSSFPHLAAKLTAAPLPVTVSLSTCPFPGSPSDNLSRIQLRVPITRILLLLFTHGKYVINARPGSHFSLIQISI